MKKQKIARVMLAGLTLLLTVALCVSCNSNTSKDMKVAHVRLVTANSTIQFPSADLVPVTADISMPHPASAPMIILCHRAFWSRGEYLEITPKLNNMGFNVMAVDLRSGDTIHGITNKTNVSATVMDKTTRFMDSLPDIEAAVNYAVKTWNPETLILWGSSYSSSLGFIVAKNNSDKIDAYIAFSPGEYFADPEQGKPANWIATEAAGVTIPVFVSADSTEVEATMAIFNKIASTKKTSFFPKGESRHGAEALFETSPASVETWAALSGFLQQFAPKR